MAGLAGRLNGNASAVAHMDAVEAATWLTVVRRERIREALAFDGDFIAVGFVEVRPGD